MRQTRQYYPGHLRRVNPSDGVVLDIALPVEPVAESPDGAVVGVLAVVAVEVGKEQVDVIVSELIISDEWLEACFIELKCSH